MAQRQTISDRIRRAILAVHWSEADIAREAGIARSTVSRFMRGQSTLTLETADRICRLLDLELTPRTRKRGAHAKAS